MDITESPAMLARAIGRYEVAKHDALAGLLQPGDTFVDVGVNKGDFTLHAAKIVGDSGHVLSFEPEPTNCKWIEESICLNKYANTQLFPVALSDSDGEGTLYLGKRSGWHTLVPNQESRNCGTIRVNTRTLDKVLAEIGFAPAIDVIKIDVEGAEMNVLRGAKGVLSENPDIILLIDIHPMMGGDPKDLCSYLQAQGFLIYREQPPYSVPVNEYADLTSIVARRI
ncbi:MAG: FkbM family methyltransferase [Anaerolineae bacterium]|nr:FkbM family methyltransferase [Anaerolineae bacterium]